MPRFKPESGPNPRPRRRHARGAKAENDAERFLSSKGLTCLSRNYHCRFGEIDIIMRDRAQIVFIEVRYRSQPFFGGALASVNRHKQARLIRTARHYLAYEAGSMNAPCRFDVVAVSDAHFPIQWVKNAFDLTD